MNTTIIITIAKYAILFFVIYQAILLIRTLGDKKGHFISLATTTLDHAIGKSNSLYFSEANLRSLMSKYGILYLFHDYNMEPSTFVLIKGFCGLCAGLLASSISHTILIKLICFIIFAIIGFCLPDILFKESNKSDNLDMINDIVTIYTSLKIYTTSNVYMTTALIECQRLISNKRLKEAMSELNNNLLSGKVSMNDAIDLFNSRFSNDQIDNLCVIIKQSLKTGYASDILADITKQIEDTNKVRFEEKKKQAQRKMAIRQVLFFVCLAAIAFYISGMEMLDTVFHI